MDCGPPGSSVHETFQARILEGLPFPPTSASFFFLFFMHLACCLFLPPQYKFLGMEMFISLLMFTNACTVPGMQSVLNTC